MQEQKTASESVTAPVPLRAGAGLKPQHYSDIIERQPDIGWFEIHPENYMGGGGPPLRYLERIRRDYPLSLHSVGVSLGSHLPPDTDHLWQLKRLVDRFQPGLVSEHLSWSHGYQWFTHDLIPLVYTEQALRMVVEHIDLVQGVLQRPILLENPSSYLQFKDSEMPEAVFLTEAARRSGAGLLLDLNNVFVSCSNHGWDIDRYLSQIPPDMVDEVHLAGHSVQQLGAGELLVDDHGSPVCSQVWQLYRDWLGKVGRVPTLIEWDSNIPAFDQLYREVRFADEIMDSAEVKSHEVAG